MRVVEIETQAHQKRYVVVDEEGRLIAPIVHYLKYLDRINSARQTLRSYATALRLYWEFLSQERLDWQQITLDDLSRFVLWLKLPSGSLNVLPAYPVEQARSNRTINHTLTVVRGFYDYQWRMEEVSTHVKEKTTTSLPARARRYKGFLYHITKGSLIDKIFSDKKKRSDNAPKPSRRTRSGICSTPVLTSETGFWYGFCMKRRCAWENRWLFLWKISTLPRIAFIFVIVESFQMEPK
jgi:integrase/recombinase XerD